MKNLSMIALSFYSNEYKRLIFKFNYIFVSYRSIYMYFWWISISWLFFILCKNRTLIKFMLLSFQLMAEHRNLRRAFRKLDVHRKGHLGVTDFRRALTGCNIPVSNEDFYHILSEFDQDMRGCVSYNEFLSTFLDNMWHPSTICDVPP